MSNELGKIVDEVGTSTRRINGRMRLLESGARRVRDAIPMERGGKLQRRGTRHRRQRR